MDNVRTFRLGPPFFKSVGVARIPHFSASSQCDQAGEFRPSPSSVTPGLEVRIFVVCWQEKVLGAVGTILSCMPAALVD
ncbi:hypothetical protein SAMN04487912_103561 [Arthrobacter sp. cf158]|nr:hypothetical protein SAMN04487912_103561 [Arthrobacter sp. cf158]